MGSTLLERIEVQPSQQVHQPTEPFEDTTGQVTGKNQQRPSRRMRRQMLAEEQLLTFIREEMPILHLVLKPKKRRWQPRRHSTRRPVGYSSTHRNSEAKRIRQMMRNGPKPDHVSTSRLIREERDLAEFATT